MATKTKKVVQYLRCGWKPEAGAGKHLEKCLKESYRDKATNSQRTYTIYDGEVVGSDYNSARNYFFGVLVFRIPEGQMGVLPDLPEAPKAPMGAANAPKETQFVKKAAYFLVIENHVLFCGLNWRYQILQSYLARLFDKDLFAQMAGIAPVVPPNILKIIARDGVQQVELMVKMYQASLLREEEQKGGIQRVMARLGRAWYPALKTKTKKDRPNSDFRFNMRLSADKRSEYDDLPQQLDDLGDIATAVLTDVETGDSLLKSITTGTGTKLTWDKLEVKEMIEFMQLGKDAALNFEDTERKMRLYFAKLVETGVIVS